MAIVASIAITAGVAAYQSYEAHKATDAQKKAVTEAQGFQERQWAQTQENLAPQLAMGKNAMSSLNVAMGGGGASPVVNQPQAKLSLGDMERPIYNPATDATRLERPIYNPAADRTKVEPMGGGAGYVTMRAPDGSRARVRASDVQQFQAKGAVVEGSGAGPTTQTGSAYKPSQQAF